MVFRDGFVTEKVTTLYEAIGGDPIVRALTHRFYELMDRLPEAGTCAPCIRRAFRAAKRNSTNI